MEWHVRTRGRGSFGKFFHHETTVPEQDWNLIERRLSEAWSDVCRFIADHMHQHPNESWNVLVCSIRPDNGHLMIVPCEEPLRWNTERVMYAYVIHLPFIEEVYYLLPCADDAPEQFDVEHDALMERAFEAVVRSVSGEPLRCLRQVRPFELWRCEYADNETLKKLAI